MKSRSVRSLILAACLLVQLGTACSQAHGAPGDVDLSFDAGSGIIDGRVNAVALQPDGKMIIGGDFRTVKGLVRRNIARLNADGSGDGSFVDVRSEMGFELGDVVPVVLQPDGKVLVGYASGITRLNSDGSVDTNFVAPSTLDDNLFTVGVLAVALQSDGKILIGGIFTIVNNFFRNGIARLNADGTLDTTFDPGSGVIGFFPVVHSITVQSDGKVLIGGRFFAYDGTYRPNLARLNPDGGLDNAFDPEMLEDGSVDAVALQPDGKVLIGGAFNQVNGANRNSIARLNANGSVDGSFNPGTGLDGGYAISIALQSDGKVLVGGYFLTVNGTNRNRLARLNADGSLDGTFEPDPGPRADVFAVVVQPDGKVLVGCADILGTGAIYNLLARLNADGNRDGTFILGEGVIGASGIKLQPDGKVLFAGAYALGDGAAIRGVCRVNADGSLDTSFNPDPLPDGVVLVIALQPDGKVLFGGHPGVINGTHHNGIARLNADGSLDNSFNPGTGVDYAVRSIAAQPDGKVLIGGGFYTVNGTDRPGLARLNSNGSLDTSFDPRREDLGSSVMCMTRQTDGKLLIGGDAVIHENGTMRGGITRLNTDGSLDNSFHFGRLGHVSSIVLQSDGKMLIGGAIRSAIDDNYPTWIARLHTDGSLDTTFHAAEAFDPDSGTLGVSSITLQPDGRMFVSGNYYLGNDNYILGLYRLHADGSLDGTFNPSGGLPFGVGPIGLQPDGNLIVAHGPTPIKGVTRPYLARLYGDASAPSLSIARLNALLIVSWPSASTGFVLQQNTNLNTTNWTVPSETITDNGTTKLITVSPTLGNRFYRLLKP